MGKSTLYWERVDELSLLNFKNKDHINEVRRKRRQTEEGAKRVAADNKRYGIKHRKKLTQKYLNKRRTDPNFKILTILRV